MAWGDDAPLVDASQYQPQRMPVGSPAGSGGGPLTQPHVTVYPEPNRASEIPDYLRPLFGKIERGESAGRDVLYGGAPVPPGNVIPGAVGPTGRQTHAFSEFQFEPNTWNDANAAARSQGRTLNKDERRDREWAALWVARRDYKARTGRDLDEDAKTGKLEESALHDTWTSLKGKTGWDAAPVVSAKGWKVSPSAIAYEQDRGDVRWMSPEDYLAMSPEITSDSPQRLSLRHSIERGEDIEEIPTLDVKPEGKKLTVYDQDGRNRAIAAKEAGVDLIPVAIRGAGKDEQYEQIQGMRGEPRAYDFQQVAKAEATPSEKFYSGLRSTLIEGPAQLAEHLLPASITRAINQLNNVLAEHGVPLRKIPEGGLDEYERQRQAELEKTKSAGSLPYVSGEIAGTVPLSALAPGPSAATLLAMLGRAAIGGALGGAAEPVTEPGNFWWDKGGQVAMGAGAGAVLGAVGRFAGQAIGPKFRAPVNMLMNEGVRLTPGQLAGGAARRAEDALGSVPLLGSAVRSGQRRAIEDFNRAAWNRVLDPIGKKLPSGMTGRDAATFVEDALNREYDRIVPNLRGHADRQFLADIHGIAINARNHLPDAQFSEFSRIVRTELMQKASTAWDGRTLKGIDSELKRYARGYRSERSFNDRQLGHYVQDLQTAFRSTLERQNPRYSADLKAVDDAWARFVRVDRAASSLGSADGTFTPAQLSNAVRAEDPSLKKRSYAKGKALLQDLSDAAKDVLPRTVPDSGTPERALTAAVFGGLAHIEPHTLIGTVGGSVPYTRMGMNALRTWATALPQTRKALAGPIRAAGSYLAPGAPIALSNLAPNPRPER